MTVIRSRLRHPREFHLALVNRRAVVCLQILAHSKFIGARRKEEPILAVELGAIDVYHYFALADQLIGC
jgi:hypothetical protein